MNDPRHARFGALSVGFLDDGDVPSAVSAGLSRSFGPAVLTAATRLRIFIVDTQEVENEDTRSEVGE